MPTTPYGGQTPASAPASRVYRSSQPPAQVRFPARRTSVKTYGRRRSIRALDQQTLTQLDYIVAADREDMDEDGDRRQKRRRTMGNARPSFHTQTLTQLLSGPGTPHDGDHGEGGGGGSDDGDRQVRDSQDEDDFEIVGETRTNSVVPQTPAKQRTTTAIEVPSSQSPLTPMLQRYPLDHPSPLRKTPGEGDDSTASPESRSTRRLNLSIQDSYSTGPASVESKTFRTPPGRVPLAVLPFSGENARGKMEFHAGLPKAQMVYEIPDSDDELASMGPTPAMSRTVDAEAIVKDQRPGTPTPRPRPGRAGTKSARELESPTTYRRLEAEEAEEAAGSHPADVPPVTSSDVPTPTASIALPQALVISSPTPEKYTPVSSPPAKTPQANATAARSQYYASQVLESQRVPLDTIRAMGPPTDRTDIILSIDPLEVAKIVEGIKTHEFRNYRIPPTVARIWVYEPKPRHELRYMAVVGGVEEVGMTDAADRGVGNGDFNDGNATRFAYEMEQVYELNNPVPLDVMRRNGWVEEAPEKYVYVPPAVVGQLLGNLRCALFEDAAATHGEPDLSVSQELATQIRSDIEQAEQTALDGSDEVIPASQDESHLPAAEHGESQGSGDVIPQSSFAIPPPPPTNRTTKSKHVGSTRSKGVVSFSQATTASQPSSPEKSMPQSMPQSTPWRPPLPSSGQSLPQPMDSSPLETRLALAPTYGSGTCSVGSLSQLHLPDSFFDDVKRAPVVLDSEGDDDDEI